MTAKRLADFCEAKRADTQEEKRVEFSVHEARRAGLWDERAVVRERNEAGVWDDVPNTSPWYRYPHRMLAWRAAGYCLRELFADVLGGIRDEFETGEIEFGSTRAFDETSRLGDTLSEPLVGRPGRSEKTGPAVPPSPPPPPPEPVAAAMVSEAKAPETLLGKLEQCLDMATSESEVETCWREHDPGALVGDNAKTLKRARQLKAARLKALSSGNRG